MTDNEPRMRGVVVVSLHNVTREEYEWAIGQIGRACTGDWPEFGIDRRIHASLDEAVFDQVVSAFFPQPSEADGSWRR